jgi:hypothetical protein
MLRTLDSEFTAFVDAIDGLRDERMLQVWYGEWSVRDILAHIIGWYRESVAALERIARGERPVPDGVDYSDGDAWNARFVEAWRNASPATVVAELRASKETLAAAARQVLESRFEEGRAGHRTLTVTIGDYQGHAPDIREWRQKEGI